ncbi:MAG: ArnT family glycosyltransferase [Candidatus Merdisoma sp.]|jgi:hypothetical protein
MKEKAGALARDFAPEAATLAVLAAVFWVFMKTGMLNDRELVQPLLWHLMILICIGTLILAFCKKLTYERLISVILLAGLIMRIGFVLYKNTDAAYHDLGEITTENAYGHAAYVLTIFETGRLPSINRGQFYHPPFFHILAACAMKVTGKVLNITDEVWLFEATKIVSCAATCFTLIAFWKILKELKLGKTSKVIALSIGAFLPVFYMLGGWINNDALVTMFMTWIILYTIRWYKKPGYFHIVMLALSFGLGIFTKISCALLAFYTGFFMLLKLVRSVREGTWKGLIGQFAVFACIAFPIGLYFPIRNYLLFGQGLNYVLPPGDNIYCGDHGFIERFVTFPISRLLSPVYLDPFSEYNLNFYLIKSAVVGEFEYHHVEEWPAAVLIVCNLILVVQSVFAAACVAAGRRKGSVHELFRKSGLHLWGILGLWIWLYLNHVVLNIRLPYGCTMDFRYIVPTALIGAVFLGIYVEKCVREPNLFRRVFAGVCAAALICMTVSGMYMFSNMFKF